VFFGVIWPLAIAAVLALILRPVVDVLQARLRGRRSVAVVLLYGAFALVTTTVLVVAVPPIMDQLIAFIAYVPVLWANTSDYLQQHYPQWVAFTQRQLAHPGVRQIADTVVAEGQAMFTQAMPSLRTAGGGVFGGIAFLTHVAIIPVYLFFFLLTRRGPTTKLPTHLPFLPPGVRDDVVFLVREFVTIVESFFRGQLLIALIMGTLLALGFSLVGLKFGLVIGLAVGVLNVVPYLGTIVGLAVALPLAFFQPGGGWALVGLVLLTKVAVQSLEGWVLTPKIMGDRTGLHPVTIIVALFFWGTAFGGVLGMLLAIPLTAFFVTAWRLVRQKYFAAPHA
jgi:predicted PurR-regulated permease PerM